MKAKNLRRYTKEYTGRSIDKSVEMEHDLATHISNTGKEQIKRRRKAGLSAYYIKEGQIVELRPDRTEIFVQKIDSRWIKLQKGKRTVVLE